MSGEARFPLPDDDPATIGDEAAWFRDVEESMGRMCSYLDKTRGHIADGWAGLTAEKAKTRVLALRKAATQMEQSAQSNAGDLNGFSTYVVEVQRRVKDIQAKWDEYGAQLASEEAQTIGIDAGAGNVLVGQCRVTPAARLKVSTNALDSEYARLMDELDAERARVVLLLESRELPEMPALMAGESRAIVASMPGLDVALTLAKFSAELTLARTGGPKDVSAWWETLSDVDEALLMAWMPDIVGAADGIPAMARDHANRQVLAADKQRIEEEIAALRREADSLETENARQQALCQHIAGLHNKLATIKAVEGTISPEAARGDGWEPDWNDPANTNYRSLLVWSLNGDGQPLAAVGVGDVGGADHLGIFTPGNGTTVQGDLSRYTTDVQNLADKARDATDDSVAMVAWLGYEAPQMISEGFDSSLLSARRAELGAQSLASFSGGLHHSHTGDPHLTLVGHSYGSTTSGIAAENGLSRADDLVVFGSPGAGSGTKVMGKDHLFSLTASEDPISPISVIPRGPWGGPLDGFLDLETDTRDGFTGFNGHSGYLEKDSMSQYNIAQVIAGNYDGVIRNQPLPQPLPSP